MNNEEKLDLREAYDEEDWYRHNREILFGKDWKNEQLQEIRSSNEYPTSSNERT